MTTMKPMSDEETKRMARAAGVQFDCKNVTFAGMTGIAMNEDELMVFARAIIAARDAQHEAIAVEPLKRWLAVGLSPDTVRLVPVPEPSTGPDVFCKLLDAEAAIRVARASQPPAEPEAMAVLRENAERYRFLRDAPMATRDRLEHYGGPELDLVIDALVDAQPSGDKP